MGLNLKSLEDEIGKSINVLNRKQVEEEFEKIVLEPAKNKEICFLVGGDPLIATTHAELILRAKKAGIKIMVVHNSSIYSAVAECGLQAYRFGKSTTIVFWTDKFRPTSFHEVIASNLASDLHTLCFLDIDSEKERFMSPGEAMDILLKIDSEKNEGVFTKDTRVIVMSRIGSENPGIVQGKVAELKEKDFGNPLHVLVIPSSLHPVEDEYLNSL
jgi:diphthine synthase